MTRSEYAKAMRANGWILWACEGDRTSFTCEAIGCTHARVATDDMIARGAVHARCGARHERGFAGHVVNSQEELRDQLRDRRIRLGLSQEDVEAAGGLTVDHVGKLETNVRFPQFPTFMAWAWTLGYDLVLVPRGLPDQVLAIIDHKAGRPVQSRRPPTCLLLPDATERQRDPA